MPVNDRFRSAEPEDMVVPATHAVALTKSDTDTFKVTRAIYIGGDGNIVVKMADDTNSVTFTGVLAGQIYPFRIYALMSTNTTATGVVALY